MRDGEGEGGMVREPGGIGEGEEGMVREEGGRHW